MLCSEGAVARRLYTGGGGGGMRPLMRMTQPRLQQPRRVCSLVLCCSCAVFRASCEGCSHEFNSKFQPSV